MPITVITLPNGNIQTTITFPDGGTEVSVTDPDGNPVIEVNTYTTPTGEEQVDVNDYTDPSTGELVSDPIVTQTTTPSPSPSPSEYPVPDDLKEPVNGKEEYPRPNSETINGWKRKKFAEGYKLSSLTPFIKLYVIMNGDEMLQYENIVKGNNSTAPPGFVDCFKRAINLDLLNVDDRKLRTINDQIVGTEDNAKNLKIIDMNPFGVSQASENNWDGGFGIKSFSSSRTTESPLTENFTMEIQLNNPEEIRNKYEFNKLITVGSHFLVMYGWSADGPALAYNSQNRTLSLDLSETGYINRGLWRYCFVQLHKFDFNFDNLGRMEGTLDFIAAQNSEMIFNMAGRMKNLGNAVKIFMNSRFVGNTTEVDAQVEQLEIYDPNAGEEQGQETAEGAGEETNASSLLTPSGEFTTGSVGRARSTAQDLSIRVISGALGDGVYYSLGRYYYRPAVSYSGAAWAYGARLPSMLFVSAAATYGELSGKAATASGSLWSSVREIGRRKNDVWIPSSYYSGLPEEGFDPKDNVTSGTETKKDLISMFTIFIPGTFNGNNFSPSKKTLLGGGIHSFAATNTGASNELRIGSKNFDNYFYGRQLFNEIVDEGKKPAITKLEKQYEIYYDIMKKMSEGVIVTKLANESTDKVRVIGEDIVFYYLGWVLEAFSYYNKKFGGKKILINHSPLLQPKSSPYIQRFRTAVSARVDSIYRESRGNDDDQYDTGRQPTYRVDVARQLGQEPGDNRRYPIRIEKENVPTKRPSDFDDWAKKEGEETAQGLYYEEIISGLGYEGVVNPQIEAEITSDGDIWKTDGTLTGIEPPETGARQLAYQGAKTEGTIRKNRSLNDDGSVDNTNKDFDMFIPIGNAIPFYRPKFSTGDEEGGDVLTNVELYTGYDSKDIQNTAEVPLDADKVDEILTSSEGMQFGDIVLQILTDAVAIEGLDLAMVPQNNGDIKIVPAGAIPANLERFNLDYTPEQLSYFREGNNFILDYRTPNSLIKNLNVSSKMDPNIAFLYGAGVRSLGSKKDVLTFINQNVKNNPNAPDFSNFAANWLRDNQANITLEEGTTNEELRNQIYQSSISFNEYDVTKTSSSLNSEQLQALEKLPDDLFAAYLSTDYKLYEALNVQLMSRGNFVNSLFGYYMNQLEVIIHGTTGLECMQFIQLKGVANLINGYYCILGIDDKVGVADFETSLKLMLIAPESRIESRLYEEPSIPPTLPTNSNSAAAAAATDYYSQQAEFYAEMRERAIAENPDLSPERRAENTREKLNQIENGPPSGGYRGF